MDRTLVTRIAFALLLIGSFARGAFAQPATDEAATIERLKAETERARAEAERARAETERMKTAAELGLAESVAPVDPGAYLRDGFFLRLALGSGYSGFRSSGTLSGVRGVSDPSDDDAVGIGALSIGGIVAPNLALHADIWGTGGLLEDIDGNEFSMSNGTLGLGATWYWMPWNAYVSGAVGVAVTTWHNNDDCVERDEFDGAMGVGTYLMIGKEWWVSENWSIGAGLRGTYAWTTDSDVTFHHVGAQALFTATFN